MPSLDDELLALLRAAPGRRYLDGFTVAELRADLAPERSVTSQQITAALKRLRAAGVVTYEPRKQIFMGTAPYRRSGWGWQKAMWFLCAQVTLDAEPIT